jgi:hypothetical protein
MNVRGAPCITTRRAHNPMFMNSSLTGVTGCLARVDERDDQTLNVSHVSLLR